MIGGMNFGWMLPPLLMLLCWMGVSVFAGRLVGFMVTFIFFTGLIVFLSTGEYFLQ
jgi:hypothetical protein